MWTRNTIACVLTVALLAAAPVYAQGKGGGKGGGKPGSGPEPEPEPDPTSICADSSGVFPAMAYSKVSRDRKGRVTGSQIFLSNSAGDCSEEVLSSSYGGFLDVSYRQIGIVGMIAWSQAVDENAGRSDRGKPVVKMLKFNVVDRAIENKSLTTVYMHPEGEHVGISQAELSRNGNTIFYLFEKADEVNGGWVDSIHSIDISSCSSGCTALPVLSNIKAVLTAVTVNDNEDKLFVTGYDYLKSYQFVSVSERAWGSWSALRPVVSSLGGYYGQDFSFAGTSVTNWDASGDGNAREVLAVTIRNSSGSLIDVVDVEDCSALENTQSCLSSGDSTVLRSGLVGSSPSFTSTPSTSDDFTAPNLLYVDNGMVIDLDIDSMSYNRLFEGQNPDSAD